MKRADSQGTREFNQHKSRIKANSSKRPICPFGYRRFGEFTESFDISPTLDLAPKLQFILYNMNFKITSLQGETNIFVSPILLKQGVGSPFMM